MTRDDGKEDLVIEISRRPKLLVKEGEHIEGHTADGGPVDP